MRFFSRLYFLYICVYSKILYFLIIKNLYMNFIMI